MNTFEAMIGRAQTGRRPAGARARQDASALPYGTAKLRTPGSYLSRPAGPRVQAALKVGPVDDPLEREADAVAEQVVSNGGGAAGPVPGAATVQRACSSCAEEGVQRMEEEEEPVQMKPADTVQRMEEEEEMAQPKSREGAGPPSPQAASAAVSSLSGGQPLDSGTRGYFERSFDRDFSSVRVFPNADSATSALSARAFTHGSDVAFSSGEYQPSSPTGQKLLAHELTHVVQQGRAPRLDRARD